MHNIIETVLTNAGFNLDDNKIAQLSKYYHLLIEWNQKFNLTAITDAKDVAVKHFLDSLHGHEYVSGDVCDVGSGAGLPAIPLKIFKPGIKLTMMDSVNKKVLFLQEVITVLGLKNAEAIHIRAEDAAKGIYREKFDCVTARAVAKLNTLSEYCIPLVKAGGVFVAYKGSAAEEIEQAGKAITILGGRLDTVKNISLTDDYGERNIIVIKKISSSPAKYPRGKGMERSSPLV